MKKGLLCKMSQGEYVLSLLSHSSSGEATKRQQKKVGHHLLHFRLRATIAPWRTKFPKSKKNGIEFWQYNQKSKGMYAHQGLINKI